MATFTFQPDFAVHPGEILKESLDERGMAQSELALRLGLTEKAVSQIINGVAPVSPETALKLERALGVPARFWNNLQRAWLEHQTAEASREQLAEHLDWLKLIPWPELVKRGAVEETGDRTGRVEQALAFFGVADVPAWWNIWERPGYAFKRSGNSVKHPGKVAAWLRLGELAGQQIDCEPYDSGRFLAALARIRQLTREPLGSVLKDAFALCARAGVAAVLTKPIPSAGIDGATRWLTRDKALIQVSGRYQTEDMLWFAFFHEAGHVLLHGKRSVFLEGLGHDSKEEHEANSFAATALIPSAAAHDLPTLKRRTESATQTAISGFARSEGIAPGLVVGRLQHDGFIPRGWCNGLKRKLQ